MKKNYLLIVLLFVLVTVSAQINLTNGLVAYYPFNGNANDESGNGNNGTVYGNVTLTTDRFGNANSAYFFTQQTGSFLPPDYIEMADNNSLDLSQEYSISVWFNQYTLNPYGRGLKILDKATPGLGDAYSIDTYDNVGGDNTVRFSPNANLLVSSQAHTLNQWHHIVMTFDNGSAKIYVDGAIKASANMGIATSNSNTLRVGAPHNPIFENVNFNGKIDDVRLYNRILNITEITALYTGVTYSVTVGADQTICSGSTVSLTANPNLLPSTYLWNTGATTKSINFSAQSTTTYYVLSTYTTGAQASDTVKINVTPINLSDGLVAYYPFNGNANDESGNGNNGTVLGNVALTTDRFGNANSAYLFTQQNTGFLPPDYIEIPDNNSIDLSTAYSISFWFNQYSINPYGRGYRIIDKQTPGLADGYTIDTWSGYTFDKKTLRLAHEGLVHSSSSHSLNQWHHAIIIFNNGNSQIYIDDLLKANIMDTSYTNINSLSLRIGAPHTPIAENLNFNGKIDDIRIYNRALSGCEVAELYNENDTTVCFVNAGSDQSICIGNSANLVATGSSNILSYLWSNGATTQTINVSPASNENYSVTAFGPNGCTAVDNVSVSVENCTPNTVVPICIVGVRKTNKNIIVWNKPIATDIDSFFVYKESNQAGVYSLIGSQHYSVFSTFVDSNSNPRQQAYLYKLAYKSTNGQISALSDLHKTIHLTINSGVGGAWNLIWNHYEGINMSSYNIYRGTSVDNMSLLKTISSSLNSYTDLNPPSGNVYYKITAVNSNGCTPTAKTESYSESESNVVDNLTTSIKNNFTLNQVFVYPNPNNGEFTIEIDKTLNEEMNAILFNSLGQHVYQTKLIGSKTSIILNGMTKGIYFLRINCDSDTSVRRVILE